MNQLVPLGSPMLPALVAAAGERAAMRFLEFFAANIRNPHTRRAYARAAEEFLAWCAASGVPSIAAVQPVHVAAWIEAGTRTLAAPSVKQRLAALRHLFDWLVNGQVVPINPAHTVRGPRHIVTCGQTPVLDPAEARALLDSIGTATHAGLRDRALIGLMVYSFARIGAALGMTVEDVFTQNRRLWVRLREKGGKRHAMPCHHNLEEYLVTYLDGAVLRGDPKGPLFRTIGRGTGKLTRTVLPQANAYAMIRRRAAAAGIATSSATTASGRPGSPPISRTAAPSKRPRQWRITPRRAQRSSTIADATRSASTRSNGSRFDANTRSVSKRYSMKVARISGTENYANEAPELLKRYESISFADAHAPVLQLIPPAPCRALDIGAGTGRDAAGLAVLGYSVVAVEPTEELRRGAMLLHPSPMIEWLDDSLPDLAFVRARKEEFDLVMLTAVWMHLDEAQRQRAMPNVSAVARDGGIVIISLRHGPIPSGRRMFEVSAEETIALARRSNLFCTLNRGAEASLRQPGVSWTRLAFQKSSDDNTS